ncbi:MAG: hypothetical protein GEV03_04710 [Streptosporangiales bacterium]|nr:hypothetical protein [Streptosporangiales bacterium]
MREGIEEREAEREIRWEAVFLGVLLAAGAVYTGMAFGMEWRTPDGRIGAGFFPRLVGVGILGCSAVGLARAAVRLLRRRSRARADPSGQTPPRPYLAAMVALVGLQVVLVATLLPLGAVLASMLFLVPALAVLNPGRHVTNLTLSVALPVGMYLLLQVGLNAGLPAGVLGG